MSEPTDDLRAAVAATAGLHPELAPLLRGETTAELTEHAQRLAAVTIPAEPGTYGSPDPADGFDGGTPRETPRPMADYVRELARRDPREFNRRVEAGEIRLSELR